MFRNIRAIAAIFILRHSPSRKRWLRHLGTYLPIFEGALKDAPSEHLLTLRIMDDLAAGRLPRALNRLEKLRLYARASASEADKALYCVLLGDYYLRRGLSYEMARCMRQANRHGHRFHLPHLLLGYHYLFERWMFTYATNAFDEAITCVYKYPPLDESKRLGVAVMQSAMSLAATMMHQPEEAARLLTLAAPAEKTPDYLHASAALHAVAGHAEETEAALSALRKTAPLRHDRWCEGIRLMLAGTHPHFTVREPDPEIVSRFWSWFLREEETLLGILRDKGGNACFRYQQEHFGEIYPEKDTIDIMGVGYRMEDGKPSLTLAANHSRTCEALIAALVAACPQELSTRWNIHSCWGNPEDNVVPTPSTGGNNNV